MANGESYIPSTDQDQRVANSDSIHLGSAEQIGQEGIFAAWADQILFGYSEDPLLGNSELPKAEDLSSYISHKASEYCDIHLEHICNAITRRDKDFMLQSLAKLGCPISWELSWDDITSGDINGDYIQANLEMVIRNMCEFIGIEKSSVGDGETKQILSLCNHYIGKAASYFIKQRTTTDTSQI